MGLLDHATRMNRRLLLGLRLLGVALALALVGHWVDLRAAAQRLLALPPWVVVAGLGLGVLRVVLMALRWRILDAAGSTPRDAALPAPLPFGAYLRYRLLNSTLSLVLPSGLGGDAGRAALLAVEVPDGRASRIAVLAFDRLLGLLTLAGLGLAAGLVASDLPHRGLYLLGVGGLLLGLAGALAGAHLGLAGRLLGGLEHRAPVLRRALLEPLEAWRACTARLRGARGRLAAALGLALLAHASSFGMVVAAGVGLGLSLPIAPLLVATTVGWVVAILPISVGGLGLRELAFVLLLAPLGVEPAAATSLGFFQFLVAVILGVGALPLLLLGAPRSGAPASGRLEVRDA